MGNDISHQNSKLKSTESIINDSVFSITNKRITVSPAYLDDECLQDQERIAVLNEVFHRNIRQKQMERLASYMGIILAESLPSNFLIYGPSGTGKSVTCLHFLSVLETMAKQKNIQFHYYYVDLTTPVTCFGALNELAIALDPLTKRYKKGIALEHMQDIIIYSLRTCLHEIEQ